MDNESFVADDCWAFFFRLGGLGGEERRRAGTLLDH
jgi:hypothetical protein